MERPVTGQDLEKMGVVIGPDENRPAREIALFLGLPTSIEVEPQSNNGS